MRKINWNKKNLVLIWDKNKGYEFYFRTRKGVKDPAADPINLMPKAQWKQFLLRKITQWLAPLFGSYHKGVTNLRGFNTPFGIVLTHYEVVSKEWCLSF